jgi:hypothetical protein
VAPSAAPAAASAPTPAPAAAAPVATPVPAPPPVAAPTPEAARPYEGSRIVEVTDTRPKYKRHSTGMMAGGIVMVSFTPIALLAAWVASIEQDQCEGDYFGYNSTELRGVNCDRYDPTIYGGLISAAVLAGVGIPLIIIGGKKEPVTSAKVTPWATPQAGGVSVRFEL